MSSLTATGLVDWQRALNSENSLRIKWCDDTGIIDFTDPTWAVTCNFHRRGVIVPAVTGDILLAATDPNITIGFAPDWISGNLAIGFWQVAVIREHVPSGSHDVFRDSRLPILQVTPAV